MKRCTGKEYDREHCQTEKLGCKGCHYFIEEEINEQKISKRTKNKSD